MVEHPPPEAGPPLAEAVEGIEDMFYVYVLKSLKNGKRYVGFTSKDPATRLKEHNSGGSTWTKQNGPHQLVHQGSFAEEREARKREKFLKSGQGRMWLNENLM